MSQQINLLRAKPQPRVAAMFAVAAVAIGVAGSGWYAASASRDTALLREQVAAGDARIAKIKQATEAKKVQAQGPDAAARVEAEIADLRPKVASAAELVSSIRGGALGSAEGYSRHLSVLGTIDREDVWLTTVEVGRAGKQMALSGLANRNEAVVSYARRLNAAFRPLGVSFQAVEMRPAMLGGAAAAPGEKPLATVFKLS